jgi:hypothetical protein
VNRTVEELEISGCGIDDVGAAILACGLHQKTNIRKMNFSRNKLRGLGAATIIGATRGKPWIVVVIMNDNFFTVESMHRIATELLVYPYLSIKALEIKSDWGSGEIGKKRKLDGTYGHEENEEAGDMDESVSGDDGEAGREAGSVEGSVSENDGVPDDWEAGSVDGSVSDNDGEADREAGSVDGSENDDRARNVIECFMEAVKELKTIVHIRVGAVGNLPDYDDYLLQLTTKNRTTGENVSIP